MSETFNFDTISSEVRQNFDIERKPKGGLKAFNRRFIDALRLSFQEKEIFLFAILQWVVIALVYYLFIQMLDWIPDHVWEAAKNSESVSLPDIILNLWLLLCIGLGAYPIGILTACMGAVHLLRRQGQPSTIAACLTIVLPKSFRLWIFHWIDGWITVTQIIERLPDKDNRKTKAERAISELAYYAWKVGVAGMLPALLNSHQGLLHAGKQSIKLLKHQFIPVAAVRMGYSAMCWIVGVGGYIGCFVFMLAIDFQPKNVALHSDIYYFYQWLGIPILIAVGLVMLFLRPVYVIAICDLYADYLDNTEQSPDFGTPPSRGTSTLVAFLCFVLMIAVLYLYREPLGIVGWLSVAG